VALFGCPIEAVKPGGNAAQNVRIDFRDHITVFQSKSNEKFDWIHFESKNTHRIWVETPLT
jgi:hypothetical protein